MLGFAPTAGRPTAGGRLPAAEVVVAFTAAAITFGTITPTPVVGVSIAFTPAAIALAAASEARVGVRVEVVNLDVIYRGRPTAGQPIGASPVPVTRPAGNIAFRAPNHPVVVRDRRPVAQVIES